MSSGSGVAEVVIIKSVLELCDVAVEDSGVYSCTAGSEGEEEEEEEEDAATFQVHVLTSPGKGVMMHEIYLSGGKCYPFVTECHSIAVEILEKSVLCMDIM